MSLVTPVPQNTTIKAYKGVPWDNTLKDIRLFDTEAQRNAFLNTLLAGQWNNCSVVSVGKSIRVAAYYNNCIECNYLSFVNPQEGTTARTFYAYITSVNYVNVNTVEFTYEIDWIQTYLFDFVIQECMVLREHVNDDTFGLHLLDEGIDTGDYVIQQQVDSTFNAAVAVNVLRSDYMATIQNNMYNPGITRIYKLLDQTQINNLNTLLSEYNNVPERITFLVMAVENMQSNATTFEAQYFQENNFINRVNVFKEYQDATSGYTPQNNKMYTSPYCVITVDNYNGDVEQYKWEQTAAGTVFNYRVDGACLPKPILRCYPYNYMGSSGSQGVKQMQVCFDNFPMLPYATDTFKAWVSEFGRSYQINQNASIASSAFGAASQIVRGDITGAIDTGISAYNNYVQSQQEKTSHQIHSLQLHGSIGQAGIAFADYHIGFRVIQYGIKPQRAQEIDMFFTRYGYRQDKVKVPNIRGRQYVNYVKCQDAIVEGNVAVDAKLQLERALDMGTSFWHVNNVGGHLTSNPIVATS